MLTTIDMFVKEIKKVVLFTLLGTLIFGTGCKKPDDESTKKPTTPSSQVQKRIFPNVDSLVRTASIVMDVASSNTVTLTHGVTYTDMVITIPRTEGESKDHPEHICILATDLLSEGISMRVATPDNSVEIPIGVWPRATLTNMAKDLESETLSVIGMTNADFWNTTTFTPRGPVYSNGTVMCDKFDPAWSKQGISFVGRAKGGQMKIYYSSDYPAMKSIFSDVTGSGVVLVYGSKVQDGIDDLEKGREPRTAIGHTSSDFCFQLCVDGRKAGVSEGMTMSELASIFSALGCKAAVNLDGGGSTQMLIRDPSSGEFRICNNPFDGSERPVIDGWAIVKAK